MVEYKETIFSWLPLLNKQIELDFYTVIYDQLSQEFAITHLQ